MPFTAAEQTLANMVPQLSSSGARTARLERGGSGYYSPVALDLVEQLDLPN
ncbi:MAG: hypothetical protein JWR19_3732 [Pedosphaera sp.]|nr:hypothetical protein [Pedosphaera sp.]